MLTTGCRERLFNFILLARYSGLVLDHQVNLVLQHDDVLEPHNVHRNQMLSRLRLWVRLVTGHEQQCRVHDRGTCQHSRHKGIVTWAIDERDVTSQNERRVAKAAIGRIGLVRTERFEAVGWLAADAFVELGVGVAELDRDIPQLLSE